MPTDLWLSDALRDPALSEAASLLLRAMDITSGGGSAAAATSTPKSADAGTSAVDAPPRAVPPAPHQPPGEVLSSTAAIAAETIQHPPIAAGNGGTPVLVSDGGGPPGSSHFQGFSPPGSPHRNVLGEAAAVVPIPEPSRGWVARSETEGSGGGYVGSPCKRASPATSVFQKGQDQHSPRKRGRVFVEVASNACRLKSPCSKQENTLQKFFRALLSSRGYSPITAKSSQCGYRIRPTPLQKASYGTAVLAAVRQKNAAALRSLLTSGLSPNPCSTFSEGVLHITCKRGETSLVRAQLESGANVRIADDLGRTPLHHAAWAGHRTDFIIVGMLLDREPELMRVADEGGRTPLDFVALPSQREEWRAFISSRADRYWPRKTHQQVDPGPPPVVDRPEGILQDPESALPIDLAKLVASGEMSVDKVRRMRSPSAAGAVSAPFVKPNNAATGRSVGAQLPPQGEGQQGADYFSGARMFANRMA